MTTQPNLGVRPRHLLNRRTSTYKPALLARAIDFVVMGRDDPRPPEKQWWYLAMTDASGIADGVTGVGSIMPRVIPLDLAARASDDPDLARVVAESEARRADGYRVILEIFRKKAPLCDGLDPESSAPAALLCWRGRLPLPRRDARLAARRLRGLVRLTTLLDQVFGLATPPEGILSGTQPTNH